MENYLMLNGKKCELTEKQIKQLGLKMKNPYERANEMECYYYIDQHGVLMTNRDNGTYVDTNRYMGVNYCTDKELARQDALHDFLYRTLRRFSNLNGGLDIKWNLYYDKPYIVKDICDNIYKIYHSALKANDIYFIDIKTAKRAIEEIIKPFEKKHPEFVW